MEVIALLLSGVAVIAAVGAWLASARSAVASERSATAAETSADEAKRANHLAMQPVVTLETDGRVHPAGLQFRLNCDRDLDTMEVSLLRDHMGEDDRLRVFYRLHRQSEETGSRTLYDVRVGQAVVMHAVPGHIGRNDPFPPKGLVNLRCVCRLGDEEWVTWATTGEVDLRFYHWHWR